MSDTQVVLSDATLPNVRKFFVPDPGYMIVEADLEGADAQVVAWEADDEGMKHAFRNNLPLHVKNVRDVYPEVAKDMTDEEIRATNKPKGMYHNCKRRVHGYNYGASTKTMSATLRSTIYEEEEFKERWFEVHPGILEWQQRVERMLFGMQCWNCWIMFEEGLGKCPECNKHVGRTVKNMFGYRIIYFNYVEGILPQALAWIPQSSVALTCSKGGVLLEDTFDWIELLAHGHDSILFQMPLDKKSQIPIIADTLKKVALPYKDPLHIGWGVEVSESSWGEVH
tara:strand:- start:13445 stop:14290 length:846 start_codon:yes stop_codon:yes gene_type:complete